VLADNCSGYDVLVSQSAETIDLGKGQTLTVVRNYSMIVNNDPKSRDHLVVGECNGTFMNLPNGQSTGSGMCARKDKDGDTYSLQWAHRAWCRQRNLERCHRYWKVRERGREFGLVAERGSRRKSIRNEVGRHLQLVAPMPGEPYSVFW
jgi:hypothetical protein